MSIDSDQKSYRWETLEPQLYQNIKEGGIEQVEIKGVKLLIGRYQEVLFGFSPRCPHAGGHLQMGWFDGWVDEKNKEVCIVCPLHRYTYSLDHGREVNGKGCAITVYPIREENSQLLIGFAKKNWWAF